MFGRKESPVVTLVKNLAVPTLTIVGSGVAAYFGARKGVADTVEECATALQKVVPTFEGLINKAEEVATTAPAAPATSDDEVVKYKEAIKKLMAEKAELEKAAAEAKAAAKPAEAPKKEKKADKKAEDKDDAKAESQAEAK